MILPPLPAIVGPCPWCRRSRVRTLPPGDLPVLLTECCRRPVTRRTDIVGGHLTFITYDRQGDTDGPSAE